jgi:hypothetical protein
MESKLQISCVTWFRFAHPTLTIFAIPNGGQRNVITASILKAEGCLSGVSDLFLLKGNSEYNGLFIEMKFGKNGLSANQISFFAAAESEKYKCVVCKSFDEFQQIITDYLKIK